MKLILSLILSLLPFFATAAPVANFSGHWAAAEGKVSSQLPGLSGTCTHVELVIEQSDTQLLTKSYDADCSLFSAKWGPVAEDLRGGKVYEGDTEVGTIDGTTLLTTSHDGGAAYAYNLRLGSDAQGPYVETYYGTQNEAGAIVIESRLRKTAASL